MKRTWILAAVVITLSACGGSNTENTSTTTEAPKSMIAEETPETSSSTETAEAEEPQEETAVAENNGGHGEELYKTTCAACHQPDGKGIAGTFPPLAGSDYLLADRNRAIKQVKNGSEGEITVNGQTYTGVMPPQTLSNEEIAEVLTYVYTVLNNETEPVTVEQVNKVLGE